MPIFDWADFLAPLTPAVLIMSLLIGLAMGWLSRHWGQHLGNDHLYWSITSGIVFFVPLSLLRAWEGSPIWERFAATLVLWIIFVVGKWIGSARP